MLRKLQKFIDTAKRRGYKEYVMMLLHVEVQSIIDENITRKFNNPLFRNHCLATPILLFARFHAALLLILKYGFL